MFIDYQFVCYFVHCVKVHYMPTLGIQPTNSECTVQPSTPWNVNSLLWNQFQFQASMKAFEPVQPICLQIKNSHLTPSYFWYSRNKTAHVRCLGIPIHLMDKQLYCFVYWAESSLGLHGVWNNVWTFETTHLSGGFCMLSPVIETGAWLKATGIGTFWKDELIHKEIFKSSSLSV